MCPTSSTSLFDCIYTRSGIAPVQPSSTGVIGPAWSSSVWFGSRLHYKITRTESNCFNPEHYNMHHCKNKLVVVTTEWLPWLQTSWRDSGYERFALVWKSNCIRQPKVSCPVPLTNHNALTTLRPKKTSGNHCLFSLSATKVTTLWLKQPTCFCSVYPKRVDLVHQTIFFVWG